jgi:FtsH-binding integral membrane protein
MNTYLRLMGLITGLIILAGSVWVGFKAVEMHHKGVGFLCFGLLLIGGCVLESALRTTKKKK